MKIVVRAYPVKYYRVEYEDNYVVVTQGSTRRRVYKGFFFEDSGTHIWISSPCADMFQHGQKVRRYEVDTETKEWNIYEEIIVERHSAPKQEPKDNNILKELKK